MYFINISFAFDALERLPLKFGIIQTGSKLQNFGMAKAEKVIITVT
jgi:hypothetical protein